MKKTILAVLGGSLFWVSSVSFACSGCHDPSKQIKIPEAENFQSSLSIPHPITNPSIQLNVETTRLEVKQKH